MCRFFSCDTRGDGVLMYFDAEMRRKIIAGETQYQDTDSHTSIAHYFGFCGRNEDMLNRYEYNPLTGKFTVDQINTTDDSDQAEINCRSLDWSTIVPKLVIKPIVHPFRDVVAGEVTDEIVALLKQWASVVDSVGVSVRGSVWGSVWDSVGVNMRAYIGSFFTLPKWEHITHVPGEYPFQPAVDLWERGFVPSFNGKTWQLHAGPDGRIVYKMKESADDDA